MEIIAIIGLIGLVIIVGATIIMPLYVIAINANVSKIQRSLANLERIAGTRR